MEGFETDHLLDATEGCESLVVKHVFVLRYMLISKFLLPQSLVNVCKPIILQITAAPSYCSTLIQARSVAWERNGMAKAPFARDPRMPCMW